VKVGAPMLYVVLDFRTKLSESRKEIPLLGRRPEVVVLLSASHLSELPGDLRWSPAAELIVLLGPEELICPALTPARE